MHEPAPATTSDAVPSITLDYQAYYCEENVWRALQHPGLQAHPTFAVFISNAGRLCPVWGMRAAESHHHPVFWDYHVVLLERRPTRWFIWDSDTLFGLPCEAAAYVQHSFRFDLKPEFQPFFRVVDRDTFLAQFRSDRGHMLKGASWQAPPPPWPLPGGGAPSNLDQFIDMGDAGPGTVYDIAGLIGFLNGGT